MLESKYLTQNGIRRMFQHIYDKGFKYIFYNSERCVYQASQKEPCFEDDTFMYCDGFRQDFVDWFSSEVLNDLLDGQNYINLLEELGVVDWSTVEVDTPVLVKDNGDRYWHRRYFAKYENNTVYVYPHGTTNWSNEDMAIISFDHVQLAK